MISAPGAFIGAGTSEESLGATPGVVLAITGLVSIGLESSAW